LQNSRFRPGLRPVVAALVRGLPALLRTQLSSAADLRPGSLYRNQLWPVVWAREQVAGRRAVERSRELCGVLPQASAALAVRQYAPPLIGILVLPSVASLMGGPRGALETIFREALSGSPFGWLFQVYPLVFGMFYMNYGSAFSFLYWSALRCRGEAGEIALPASLRSGGRNRFSTGIRPATLAWVGVPLALLALILVRGASGDRAAAMEEALDEGRGTAVVNHLNAGLPVDYLTSNRETPLFDAVRLGQMELLETLLARGANVNARSRRGSTPLLTAATYARIDAARVLLDRGAAVDAANADGRTALIAAAMQGNLALVQLLLERGANPRLADARPKTALDYAREEGHSEVAALLERRRD
jgi:uncharacterized protein